MKPYTVLLAAAVGSIGCDVPFDPVVEGQRPNVVFALLNAALDTQVVRVHATLRPSTSDPGYPSVPGTSVVVSGPSGDIVYSAVGMDVFGDSVYVFVAPGFVPTRGGTYRLLVQADGSAATASTTVPGTCQILSGSSYVLQDPYRQPPSELIGVSAVLARETYGFLIRLVIEYEELDGTAWKTRHREVPFTLQDGAGDFVDPVAAYPRPRRRTTSIVTAGEPEREWEGFSNEVYRQSLKVIYGLTSGSIRMRRALFVVHQIDRHFFAYYSLANHFLDPNSIRVDRPDYSNVSGALGFFGAITSDTLAVSLPVDLSPP